MCHFILEASGLVAPGPSIPIAAIQQKPSSSTGCGMDPLHSGMTLRVGDCEYRMTVPSDPTLSASSMARRCRSSAVTPPVFPHYLRTPYALCCWQLKISRLVLRTGTGIQQLGALEHPGNSECTDRRTTACTGHEADFNNSHPSCRMQCDLGRPSSRMETKG
ncbi:hypothetical protein BO78DRAFT_390526 [Aspergillus sclerotiicarbonarius CBS 121057]|uniref:Uncharacterized protein n=1 Tax=Aspergillus sclerotiicarbonarius (strain CBS 121057 / IBT 28362) TaxID=1448318 RepID=A0A319F8U2_ASPSB|nr:hypothetical protein BO78DRAFT_390526 [Aspergillus sclerotiicarbonarius CBS 121057]